MKILDWIRTCVADFRWARDNRVLISIVYCNCMCALGLAIASFGPAILSLSIQTDTSLTATGYCFGARSVGYLIGSFGGPLFDRLPGHWLLGLALLVAGIAGICIPAVTHVVALGFTVSFQGFAMGFLDTGANVLLIYQHGKDVGPWMQFMHSAFAIGAFMAPLLQRVSMQRVEGRVEDVGKYDIAFIVIGVYSLVVAVILLMLKSPRGRSAEVSSAAAVDPIQAESLATANAAEQVDIRSIDASVGNIESVNAAELKDAARKDAAASESDNSAVSVTVAPQNAATSAAIAATQASKVIRNNRWLVVLLTAALLGVYVGCEAGYGSFVTAFSVVALGTSEGEGQFLAGCYWGAIMIGRIAAVPISLYVTPDKYLTVSMWGCVVSSVLLLAFQSVRVMVWIGTLGYGLCMACVFPTAIALAESYFPVQGKDATAFVVGSATGEWLLPFLIASLFGDVPDEPDIPAKAGGVTVGPVIVMWVIAVGCIVNVGLLHLLKRRGTRLSQLLKAANAAAPAAANTDAHPM